MVVDAVFPAWSNPDWAGVTGREVDEWAEPQTVVDTAAGDPVAAVLYAMGSGAG